VSTAGDRRELARYELPDGSERILCAQRVDGRVAISDIPDSDDRGRVYLVERHVESTAAMEGLVAEYVHDALRRGEPAILLPSWIEGGR